MRKLLIAFSTAFATLLAVAGTGFASDGQMDDNDQRWECGEIRGNHDCE
jgi:hypothetical protein